jgi:hypothetical protein
MVFLHYVGDCRSYFVILKVIKACIFAWFLGHKYSCPNLSAEQYGFRTKLTTENATYKLTNEVVNAMNNRLIVGGIFCDLKKVFDFVNHDILLSKLEIYGITGKEKELYQSYLKGRYQRVSIYNKDSSL